MIGSTLSNVTDAVVAQTHDGVGEVLRFAADFAERRTRPAAAERLARALGATELTIWASDPEREVFLPAPGLRPTLRDAAAWTPFLERCRLEGEHTGTLRGPDGRAVSARGCAAGTGVAVLIGADAADIDMTYLRALLPLLGSLLIAERRLDAAKVPGPSAADSARRSGVLTHALDEIGDRPGAERADAEAARAFARDTANEARNRTRAELAHVSRVSTLGALTASIIHEVNQPLSGMITNASTCLRMLDADLPNVGGARETARRMIRDGHRAVDVITRLRALFSKRERALEPLDLNEVIEEAIALSLVDLQRKRVVLRTELADGLPCVIGDRVQLQQVVLNLLLNAADAMSDVSDRARDVTIRTEREGRGGVRTTVRDSGEGVDAQSTGKLFEAFYTTKSGGMGIGLSVSQSIVERHHGRLWFEPNDGPGATFALTLPSRAAMHRYQGPIGIQRSAARRDVNSSRAKFRMDNERSHAPAARLAASVS